MIRLKGNCWDNYTTGAIEADRHVTYPRNYKLETMSITELEAWVGWLKQNAKMNKLNPDEVPVLVDVDGKEYLLESLGFGTHYMKNNFHGFVIVRDCDKLIEKTE